MDPKPFLKATREIRNQFINLIDSMSAIKSLASLDVKPPDVKSLLDDALEILMHYQDMQSSSIFLLEDRKLHCKAGVNYIEGMASDPEYEHQKRAYTPMTFHLGEGLIGIAAQTGKIQYCKDCSSDTRFKRMDPRLGKPQGCIIAVPIIFGTKTYGVFNTYHPVKNRFNKWHLNLVEVFTTILGHMLASHFMLQDLENKVSARTQELEDALLEAERLKLRYEQLSTVDDLTELHNRRFFFNEADAAISRAIRHKYDFSILMLDLDHFKEINDEYGHQAGDLVLKHVADILKSFIREGDILARYGGEEFIIALPNTDYDGAFLLAERIRLHISEIPFTYLQHRFNVCISAGVSSFPDLNDKLENAVELLVQYADKALYYVKFNGRNNVATYKNIEQQEDSA